MNTGFALTLLSGLSYVGIIPLQGYVFFFGALIVVGIYFGTLPPNYRFAGSMIELVLIHATFLVFATASIVLMAADIRYGLASLSSVSIAFIVGLYIADFFARQPPLLLLNVLVVNAWVAAALIGFYVWKHGIALRWIPDAEVQANINMIGLNIAIGIAAQIIIFSYKHSIEIRLWDLFKLLFCLLALILAVTATYSRSSLAISIFIIVFAGLKLAFSRYLPLMIMAIILIVPAVLIVYIHSSFPDLGIEWLGLIERRLNRHAGQPELRESVYFFAWETFREHSIAGIGFSNFPEEFSRSGLKAIRAHNDVLEIFVELGMFGGILMLCIIGYSIRGWAKIASQIDQRPLMVIFILLLSYSIVRPMQSNVLWFVFLFYPTAVRRVTI